MSNYQIPFAGQELESDFKLVPYYGKKYAKSIDRIPWGLYSHRN